MEIREQGRLLGTSDAERLMMAAGRHELDLVNDTLGYRASRVVVVAPGKVAPICARTSDGRREPERRAVGGSVDRRTPRRRHADRKSQRRRSVRTRWCSSIRSSVKSTMRFR